MRKIVRAMMIGCCSLASAACAHDGMLAPELAPRPESAAGRGAPTRDPMEPRVVRQPIYIVDGIVLEEPPADIDTMDIVAIEAVKVTGPGAPGIVRITTRAGGGR